MSKLIREHNKPVSAPDEALPHARLHDLRHLHATTLLLRLGSRFTWWPPGWAVPTRR